jgi:hypothetical protein
MFLDVWLWSVIYQTGKWNIEQPSRISTIAVHRLPPIKAS